MTPERDPRILSDQEMVNRRLLAPYDKALRRTVDHIDALTEALDEERAKVEKLERVANAFRKYLAPIPIGLISIPEQKMWELQAVREALAALEVTE